MTMNQLLVEFSESKLNPDYLIYSFLESARHFLKH